MKVVEQYKEIKNRLAYLASYLKEEGILSEEDYNKVSEILSKDKIKIGVAGQMKYGKSTLINALLFKRKLLPTSDIPMTATLTFIEYDEKESYTVEFFSKEEWEKIKELAKMPGEEKEQQISREILKEAQVRLGSEIENFLGKKIEVSKEDLYDYVGADGKFTPITKALYIKLPHEILKELILVDTPGFNDPVESREREAERFLQEADALIFLLYADRALDATDRDLLLNKMVQFGTGGIILVLNKYDILFEREGALEKVKEYINKIINNITNDKRLNETVRKVLKEAPFVYISSLWALLGTMPESEMSEDDKWYFEKYKNDFPFLKTKGDFLKYSNLNELEEKLLDVVKHKKIDILINKIKGLLEGSVSKREREIENAILSKKYEENLLSETKEKIEKNKKDFIEFRKEEFPRITRESDILDKLYNLIEEAKEESKDELKKIFERVNFGDIGLIDLGNYRAKVERKVLEAYIESREKIKEKLKKLKDKCKDEFRKYIDEIFNELYNHRLVKVFTKLSPEHEDNLKKSLIDEFEKLNSIEFLKIPSPVIGERIIFLGESKESAKLKALEYKDQVYQCIISSLDIAIKTFKKVIKDFLETNIKKTLKESVLNPINEAIERADENLKNKENRLKQLAQELEELNKEKERLKRIKENLKIEISKIGGM